MAVTNTTTEVSELGNGVKVAYDFAFKILAATDLLVYKELTAGVYTLQTRVETLSDPVVANEYTLLHDTDAETGTVTYSVAPVTGLRSIIRRATAHTQGTAFPREGNMPGKTIELTHDKAQLQINEIHTILGRALLQPAMPLSPDSIEIAAPVDAKGLVYLDNGDGTWTINPSTDDFNDIVADATAQKVLAVAAAAAAAGSESAVGASASAASASAGSASSSAAAAASSANTASTQAGLSAGSAEDAAASAVAAAASAADAAAAETGTSGLWAAMPANGGAARTYYYATDRDQEMMWSPAAARWFLVG